MKPNLTVIQGGLSGGETIKTEIKTPNYNWTVFAPPLWFKSGTETEAFEAESQEEQNNPKGAA